MITPESKIQPEEEYFWDPNILNLGMCIIGATVEPPLSPLEANVLIGLLNEHDAKEHTKADRALRYKIVVRAGEDCDSPYPAEERHMVLRSLWKELEGSQERIAKELETVPVQNTNLRWLKSSSAAQA